MKSNRIIISAIIATALFTGGLFSAPAHAQGKVRAVHGDWEIRCETPTGARDEQCSLVQSVIAEDRSDVGLTVIILPTADKQAHILQILAPLGVLLPSELGLFIDTSDLGRVPFLKCAIAGCFAQVIMDENLIEQFKNGQTATFTIFQTPEEGIGIPIALNGFTQGFAALN